MLTGNKLWFGNGFEPLFKVYETLPIRSANQPIKGKFYPETFPFKPNINVYEQN